MKSPREGETRPLVDEASTSTLHAHRLPHPIRSRSHHLLKVRSNDTLSVLRVQQRSGHRKKTVLFSSREPTAFENPFLRLLAESIAQEVRSRFFSWRVALLGRYDLFHVHWPELLLRDATPGARGTVRRWTKRLLFLGLLARKRLRPAPWVWTIHNLKPHEEGGAVERLLLSVFHRRVDWAILLNAEGPANLGAPTEVIPHPAYPVPDHPGARMTTDDVILFFGLVRPYKGLEDLVDAFAAARLSSTWRLVLAGDAIDEDYARLLAAKLEATPRAHGAFRPFPEPELHAQIAASRLVVLPYRNMYNSGALLLALGHGRHVLVPSTQITKALRGEIGEHWITLFEPPLSAGDLETAVEASCRVQGRPDLGRRSWEVAGAAHLKVYAEALRSVRSR